MLSSRDHLLYYSIVPLLSCHFATFKVQHSTLVPPSPKYIPLSPRSPQATPSYTWLTEEDHAPPQRKGRAQYWVGMVR